MKSLVSMHILCLLFLIACANNINQIPKSLSAYYDGIWDGSAQTTGGDQYIKMEIKNGIVSGFFEFADFTYLEVDYVSSEIEINGYITSDNKLIIKPVPIRARRDNLGMITKIILETNLMSPDRIEGTYHINKWPSVKYDWYVVKPATGKSDTMNSIVQSDILISNIWLRNLRFQNNAWDFLYGK